MRLIVGGLLVALAVAFTPSSAHAYIDPGLISTVTQGLFALVFGGAAAFILRPWTLAKSLFRRKAVAEPEAASAPAEADGDEER